MTDEAGAQPRLTRTQAAARTRARLIAAAVAVISRRGITTASVEEIAQTAGYTIGAIYAQFGSKDDLVAEAIRTHVSHRVDRARAIMESGPADAEDVRSAMGQLFGGLADDPASSALFWGELFLHAARNPEFADLLATESRAVDEVITASIVGARAAAAADGGAAAKVSPATISDEGLATVVSSLFRGLAQRRQIDPDAVPDALLGQALQLLVAGRQRVEASDEQDPA